jgi:hypothetical protein
MLTLGIFLGSWKKSIDDSQQSTPFSLFLSNICYTSEGRYSSRLDARMSTFREKRTKAYTSINLALSLSLQMTDVTQKTYCILAKNKARVHGVLSSLFEYIKYSV